MNAIDRAVMAGVRTGFEEAFYKRCSGRDDPEERCPMRPKDGCNCVWMQWQDLPWYRRLFREPPKRCEEENVIEAMIDDSIRHTLAATPHGETP